MNIGAHTSKKCNSLGHTVHIEFSLASFRPARIVFYLEFVPPKNLEPPGMWTRPGYTVLILAFSTFFLSESLVKISARRRLLRLD